MKILHKSKKALAPLPQVAELINKLLETPNEDLHEVLSQIDTWKWPRSDLNAWIKVLNKFDAILEEVIRDYDVDKLQVNVFTPLTKKTVCEILRFERLLLENSTNRKTYNSYDRLSSLMLTSDIDVLILALTLLLRPAQQYSAQAAVSHALNISTPRLISLAKRWPNLREYDINLIDLVSESGETQVNALPNEAREVNFTFYRKDAAGATIVKEQEKGKVAEVDVFGPVSQSPRKPGAPSSGPGIPTPSGAVVIHLDGETVATKEPMNILADIVEAHDVPDNEKFELLTRIRAARVVTPQQAQEREKLVTARLLATAIFGHTHSESHAQSTLFLYEPDLITHIAELLQLDRGVDVQVQTAAIYALDALARYRTKMQDILTAVNAGVNHGILMALLRKTVAEVAQPMSTLPQSFAEALLSFVTFLATHASGGNMVVGAGLIPLLVQIIENRLPNRLYVVSKTMQLVDNVLYGFMNAFQLFCNARGVEVLVDRIEYEVDLDVSQCSGELPATEVVIPYGKLSVARAAVLKHLMRSMHRMMQSSGTSEGLRGLLDSSLLNSVKKIMEHREIFGPTILALAINTMATFVHNEPTCLPVIQEKNLPEVFYALIESGLEPVIEVVQAIPNAIGALCLNQQGQEQLTARPDIVPSIFSIFTSEQHQRILQDKENAVLVGTSMEELIRHHPSLKESVFTSIKATMKKIEQLGDSFVPSEDKKQWYTLTTTPSVPPRASADEDVIMESAETEPTQQTRPVSPAIDAAHGEDVSSANRDDSSSRSHDNIVVSYLDVFCKFLEGFFQHVPHCRDFVADGDALKLFGKLTALPCLPYDFANSVASDSIVQVIRTMAESATNETLDFLVNLVHEILEDTSEFWENLQEQSKLLPLVHVNHETFSEANKRFRGLVVLHTRLSLLSDIYATAGYSHHRATSALLQSLLARPSFTIIPELGALHRACVWENIVLKAGLASQGIDTRAASVDATLETPTPSTATPADTPAADVHGTSDAATDGIANGVHGQSSTATTTPRTDPGKTESAAECNARALKHIASQIPSCLAPFFQAVVRLFQTRRSNDVTQKQKIRDAANSVADVLVKHLEQKTFDDKLSLFAYYTTVQGLATILLVDERTSQKLLHTMLLVAFNRHGGLDAIFGLCREFINTIDMVSRVPAEERSDIAKQELVHAYGGLKVALHLLHPIVSAKPLFESSQTVLAMTSDKPQTDPAYFEPHNFFVKMRLAALPLLRDLWEAPWLVSAPLSLTKSVVQIVMELLITEGEEVKEASHGPTPPTITTPFGIPRPPAPPDETRIQQLTDMGFPRYAAERALTRTRNNVNAATELLLTNPFPLPPDPEPARIAPEAAPATAPAPAPAPALEHEPEPEPAPAPAPAPADAATPPDEIAEAISELAAEPATSPEVAEASSSPDPEPVNVKTSEELLEELNAAREPLKDSIGSRALKLVDEHPTLVFDVQRVFVGSPNNYREKSVTCLIDDIKAFSSDAYGAQEQPMAVRCRLLALVLSDPSSTLAQMPEASARELMDVLLAVLTSNPSNQEGAHLVISKWLAAHLLVVEALLAMGEEPRSVTIPKEGELVETAPVTVEWQFMEARKIVFDFCLRLLALPSLPKDELLSALRIFVMLTRDHQVAHEFVRRDGVSLLFQYLRISLGTASASGTQSYVAIILRHIAEDAPTLLRVMRQEIKRFFSHPRNRLVDVTSYVSSCGALALREPRVFTKATAELCQLLHPFSSSKAISLKESLPPDQDVRKGAAGESKDVDMQVEGPFPNLNNAPSEALESLVHFLLSELMKAVRAVHSTAQSTTEHAKSQDGETSEQAGIDPSPSSSSPTAQAREDQVSPADDTYACFLMQCLTELLFSYEACKMSFLSFSPRRRIQTPAKEGPTKYRTAAIQFMLSDLVFFDTINPQPPVEAKKQIMLCNWAMSVIVALCVDTSFSQDTKDVSSDLISVRKFVLEAINRAVRDLPPSEAAERRYSRLLALADLSYRLLTVRFNANTRKTTDESPTHIAKVMLEKNFVQTLTNALAEVDLNYPHIRTVVTGILKPLEHLSKIAIKMSRVSDKNRETQEEKAESVISYVSDEEEEETADHGGDETPDLYRNSSLGLFGGEMEDMQYGDDDMDENGDEEDDDVEMDFGDETGSEDTTDTEDNEDDLEDEFEHASGESEEGWHNEDVDEEEDLVENEEENEDDDDEGDDDEDDEGEEVMWQDIAVGDEILDHVQDEGDEEDEAGVPIMQMNLEEGDVGSEEDYGDDAEAMDAPVPNVLDIATGFANAFGDGVFANDRDGPQLFWAGTVRPPRRRGVLGEDDDMEIFGRPRNPPPTAPESVTHPLLLNPGSVASRGSVAHSRRRAQRNMFVPGAPPDLLQTIEDAIGEGAAQFFQHIISHGHFGGEAIRIDLPPTALAPLRTHGRAGISAQLRLERAPRGTDPRSENRSNFDPLLTVQRWAEEVKIVHGRFEQNRLNKLINHVVLVLLPAAIQAIERAKAAAEAAKLLEPEERKDEDPTTGADTAPEPHRADVPVPGTSESTQPPVPQAVTATEEDTEMLDATAPIVPDLAAVVEPPTIAEGGTGPSTTEADVSEPSPDNDVAEAGPSEVGERVTVMIHGSPVDITDTGIDPTFLEALPDDMREEVLNQHVREQRAARVERPADSQISPEFLDALPPEIRAEILQQEGIERARQRAEETATQQRNAGGPVDIDPASFLASLDPQLRQVVLMDSDDGLIQSLPSHMLAEAGIHRDHARQARVEPTRPAPAVHQTPQKPLPTRDAIQLLERSALVTLLRLLFFPTVLRKNLLNKVLVNLCENTKTRTDLFNLVLNILQDGSGDLSAIDKSFAQMSFRSMKQGTQQTPRSAAKQRMPSDYLNTLSLPQQQNEMVPELIVQRCLEALVYIVSSNELSSLFFLTEHELPPGMRRGTHKKGKGKEKQALQTHYPVVLLLSLLDRPSILKTPSIVESVVALLATITRPLATLKDSNQVKADQPETPAIVSGPSTVQTVSNVAESSQPAEASAPAEEPPVATTPVVPETPVTAKQEEKVLLSKPPAIPHPVLRSIVNVLTAGECSGRTFSQILTLIQHLSYIPDARDVIANELRSRAQEFGQSLYNALDELADALQQCKDDALSSLIASKFSAASSDQAKLLRVLKTIDYMYSPKSTTTSGTSPSEADVEKVQSIYESFRFTPLWKRLGDCLAIIEEKPEMEHIATVLLPLIESLMVVCKYVGSKPVNTTARALRASASPRSPPATRESMEDLFVSFTDAHRKILNLMVRNNPSLMSGSFSLLVNNPRVLDFDNKRNYFNQQLHRRPHAREHHGTLQLNVRRQRVFEDSFQYLQRKTGDQIKYGKLSVRFYEEEGVDAGGVTREWFQILARQMFDPNYALFQPCAADRLTYQPNKASWVNPEHLSFFKFVGRIIGKAIYDGRLLDAYFARSLYRQILAKPVDYRDVEWVDPEYYNSLCWILENDPTPLDLTFSVEADEFGVTKIVDLKPGGASIPVTQENKKEFVQLSAQYRLYSSIKDQIESLLTGFYEIIPKDLISIFNEQELELLISGTPDIDVDEWRSATEYNGYTSSDPVIVWWWRALKSFNREERAKVLSFATGTSRVPLGGFVELQGVQGVQRFSIHKAYGDTDRLPQAHTCFNQIDLPQYSSYEMLRQQLLLAINEGGEGFGFA